MQQQSRTYFSLHSDNVTYSRTISLKFGNFIPIGDGRLVLLSCYIVSQDRSDLKPIEIVEYCNLDLSLS